MGIDADGLTTSRENVAIEELATELGALKRRWANRKCQGIKVEHGCCRPGNSAPPALGKAISAASALSREQAIPGVNQVLLLVSGDGDSRLGIPLPHLIVLVAIFSDKPQLEAADQHLVAISVATPRSQLLRTLAGGSATRCHSSLSTYFTIVIFLSQKRVIHFADWTGPAVSAQFGRWLAFAICEAVARKGQQQKTLLNTATKAMPSQPSFGGIRATTAMPKWRRLLQSHWPNKDCLLIKLSHTCICRNNVASRQRTRG